MLVAITHPGIDRKQRLLVIEVKVHFNGQSHVNGLSLAMARLKGPFAQRLRSPFLQTHAERLNDSNNFQPTLFVDHRGEDDVPVNSALLTSAVYTGLTR